ncbi:hypothetical protein [Pseudomonas sp. GZD-222]|uniref:hypothetical protein n=1 Tax=Pseudomonas sp. GZD-222 TaxID=3404805 RepID=UPI003BB565AE
MNAEIQFIIFSTGCAFWAFAAIVNAGIRPPKQPLTQTLFFKNKHYRSLFVLHRFFAVKALTIFCSLLGALPAIHFISDYALIISWEALYTTLALSAVLALAMGDQGLTVALDKRLAVSWDKGNKLRVHLIQRKINNLSHAFITSTAKALLSHIAFIRTRRIQHPILVESWLLAPKEAKKSRRLKIFRWLINWKILELIEPTKTSWYVKPLKRRAISRHRKFPTKDRKNAPKPVRFLRTLRLAMHSHKMVSVTLSVAWLLILSPVILPSLLILPKPRFSNLYKLQNGEPSTRLMSAMERAIITIQPLKKLSITKMKRMNLLSVITLVANTPRVSKQLGGWVAGAELG